MSLTLEVSLLSGKTVSLKTHGITEGACTERPGSWERSTLGLQRKRS